PSPLILLGPADEFARWLESQLREPYSPQLRLDQSYLRSSVTADASADGWRSVDPDLVPSDYLFGLSLANCCSRTGVNIHNRKKYKCQIVTVSQDALHHSDRRKKSHPVEGAGGRSQKSEDKGPPYVVSYKTARSRYSLDYPGLLAGNPAQA